MVKRLSIKPGSRCEDEPDICHNRWHPDIKPAIEVDPGEVVEVETRDALDGQILDKLGVDDVSNADLNLVHPLTGCNRFDDKFKYPWVLVNTWSYVAEESTPPC